MSLMKKFVSIALSVFLVTMQSSWSFAAITTWDELKTALETGASDSVSVNIAYDGTTQIAANQNATINLGTYTITGTESDKNAIQATTGNLQFNGGTFTGFNRTTAWGSILHLTTNGNVTFDGTNFINNTSLEAGALSSGTKGSHLTIQNALFEGNTAEQIGAVGAFTGTTVTNTIFRNNQSTTTDVNSEESGGALFLGAVSATDIGNSVNGSTFEGNISGTSGGAIATRNASLANNSAAKLDISNTTFTSNQAGTQGGAIDNYFYNDAANSGAVTIKDSTFTSNTAAEGGAIYNHGEEDKAGNAAAMYIADSSFSGNHATGLGGAIYNAGTLVLAGTNTFSNNIESYGTEDEHKNDIYNTGSLEINGNATFDGGISGEGQVDIKGTVSFTEDAEIHQENITVEDGQIATNAGTAYLDQLQGDGTFKNTGTLYLDLTDDADFTVAHLVDGATPTGQTNINVADGYEVEIAPTEFVQQKVITTGEGHLRLAGDSQAEWENYMTGNSLEIASKIDGPFTNTTGANAEFVDGAEITGLITNNGTIGIYNTTNYDVQANMTGDSSTIDANILNIGGEYNSVNYTSHVSVGAAGADSDIENQTINVNDGFLTLFDDGTNFGSISNSVLNILANGSVTGNASKIGTTTNTIGNAGTLTFTGGTNANAVTGDGTTKFTGDTTNNAAITQTNVNVTNNATLSNNAMLTAAIAVDSGATLVTDPQYLGDDVSNAGTVELNADGTLDVAITGADGLTKITGAAVVVDDTNGSITQDTIKVGTSAALTSNADNLIAATEVFNDGTLNLTGGTNANTINGDGSTVFSNDVTNNADITQTSIVNTNGTLTNNGYLLAAITNQVDGTLLTDPDNLGGDVDNAGQLTFTDKGTLSVNVSGIGITDVKKDLTNEGSINQATINVDSAAVVTTNASDFNATGFINNEGVVSYTGGTNTSDYLGGGRVDITGYVTNEGVIDQTTVTNNGVFTNNATVDANLTNNTEIAGTGNLITKDGLSSNSGTIAQANIENNGTFDNSGHITLTGALTNNATFNTNADLLSATGGVANAGDLNITGGTNANVITGDGITNFTGDATNNAAITQTGVNNSANLTNTGMITAAVTNSGTLTSDGANIAGDITNTGSYVITGGDNANDISGAGTTTIQGTTANTGNIEQEKVIVANAGAFTTDIDNVTAAIENAGAMTWTDGAANANTVTGAGSLEITGGDITNTASISQGNITITNGTLTSNADLLASTNGITNNDSLAFTGGTNNNVITGAGLLTIDGDVTNQAAINQNELVVSSGKLTTDADLVTVTPAVGITNNAAISFTGGTNTNYIKGTGTTYIDGTVQNTGNLDTLINVGTSGHYSTTTGITKALTNNGITDITNANVNAAVTGTGTFNILGNTTNNSTITQEKVTVGNAGNFTTSSNGVTADIENQGVMTWNAGSTNNNVVTGNGSLTIAGGTITNNASINQANMTIAGGSITSNADLLASANGINNLVANGLILTGGTNTNAISGSGSIITTGDVNNQAAINQTVAVSGGTLTTDAGLLGADVTNNAAVSFTGGTNTHTISGAGTTYIDGTVENTGTIDTKIGVGTSGHYATESDITKDLANNGITDITDADISAAISGTGTLNILGDTINSSTIEQGNLNIASNGDFTTNIDNVTAAINNAGDMEWTGGSANANVVTGDGALTISGGDIANTAAITQGNISISGGSLSSSADLLASTNGITNTAALELTGGTNTNVISGTGALTIGGDVANQSTIEQATITVDGGKLTTAADALTTTGGITLTNDTDAISFTSGDNLNEISGDGTVFIDGTVQGLAAVSTDIQVNTGAHYGTDQDIVANLENRGVTDLIDSDITSTGQIKGTGTLNILGDTTNSGSISQSNVSIQAGGKLTTDSTKVEAAIANEGDLEWTAGDANSNVISGAGNLTISGGDIANTAAISQGSISITGGSLTSNADLLASTAGIANDATLGLTGGTNTNAITGAGTTEFTNDVVNEADIAQATVTNAGNLTNNALIAAAVTNSGTLTSNGTNIDGAITNTGSYVITDGDNANDISGVGGALSIQGSTTNTGVIDQDTLDIANGATFVATDMDDISAGNGISNAGTFEMQGGTNNNVISGNTGTLNVTGAVTNGATATITQDTVNIATLGEFTVEDIDDVTTVNGISSTGTLILKGEGTNTNNISGTGAVEVDATGDIVNQGTIEQNSLDNAGVFESNASLLAFANGISNTNELNLTGGTNENVISGAGTTNFTNDVINNAAITQDTVTNAAGTLTNNAAITGDFTNDSGTVNNEAAITGAITNNSGTINSTATNLVGTVTSDGTLNIAGGEVQDAIDGIGTMNITDDLINAQTIAQDTVNNSANMTNSGAITVTTEFNNSGVVDNTAAITGPITNSGTINSTATNLVGAIDNDGTLNMDGGDVQADITGTGDMNITADLTNSFAIAQANVVNEANLTNDGTITADDIDNSGVITGAAADLVANNAINNSGSLVFDAASTGDSVITGTGDVQVTADTTLTAANDYTGGTLIDGADLTVAGQNNIGTGDVKFANDGYLVVTDAGELANGLLGNAATDNVNIDNADALSLTGTIGAAADFHKTGAGDMTFTMASNAYTGNTYVDEGKLIGNTGNINNVVNGAAGTTVEFNDTTDAELNEINTLGTFVQSGSAVLNVKNNAFTAAQADINAGTFAANRALTATAMNINNGATLRGNGNITGTVNVASGATLAPGNSIDTLTITGDLNLASGSTTAIEINETPASDKLVVSGNTNIASGANLTVANENGRYFEWERFDIIESGAVSGEFTYDGTVTDYDASRIDVEVDYSDPTKVALVAKRKATDYADGAAPALAGGDLSRNQHEVAKAIDAVSTGFGGDITNALLQLEQLGGLNPQNVTLINPGSNFKSALNDMSGVLYANGALTTLFNAKTAHVYDRIAKRDPSAGSCPTCHDNVWVEYYNQYDKVYADENSPHFTNNMSGMLVGYDRSSDELLLGVYTGYGKNDLRQHGGNLDIEDTTLGVYAGWRPGDWVFKGTLSGGYQSYEGDRSIAFMGRTAHGAYKGWNLALDLEGAYNWAVADWVNIKPFVGVLNSYAYQQSFTETGADALNLHVESRNQFNSQARLGVKFDGKVKNRLSWYTSAAVKQFIGDDYAKLHTSLGLPGTRMDLISAELGRTYFSGQVGLNYALNNNWSLFGNVDLGLNNKSTNCYGNLGVAYTW